MRPRLSTSWASLPARALVVAEPSHWLRVSLPASGGAPPSPRAQPQLHLSSLDVSVVTCATAQRMLPARRVSSIVARSSNCIGGAIECFRLSKQRRSLRLLGAEESRSSTWHAAPRSRFARSSWGSAVNSAFDSNLASQPRKTPAQAGFLSSSRREDRVTIGLTAIRRRGCARGKGRGGEARVAR